MNRAAGPVLCLTALALAIGTAAPCAPSGVRIAASANVHPALADGAETPAPSGSPDAAPSPAPLAAPSASPDAAPLPAVSPESAGTPVPPHVSPAPGGSPGAGPNAFPVPGSSGATPAGRFHLHRPGTDVDGDSLTGSLASHVFVLKGNVVLHSDPKIDREMAEASESDEPLTVTADELGVDQFAFTYVAKGHVHFVQGSRSGFADLATLNEEAHTLDLVGNASVLDGEHRTTAAKMHYNTADKQFVGGGDVHIYAPAPTPNPGTGTPAPKRKRRLPL